MQNENASRVPPDRLTITYLIIGFAVLVYVVRLFSLQILQGKGYLAQAEANRLDEINIPAPRGVIYDRNGVQLVANIPSFRVSITPALLPDSEAEVQAIFKRISALTGVPFDTPVTDFALPDAGCIDPKFNVGILNFVGVADTYDPYKAWPVACDLDETIARVLREEQVDLPGVQVEAVPIRSYTTGELTAQIIGYMGPIPASLEEYYTNLGFVPARDRVGYAGIEVGPDGIYQDILAGHNGLKDVERDVAGQVLRDIGTFTQAQPGNSLQLSLDTRLQAAAEAALANRIEFINRYASEERSPMGAVIAMNPQTGEILAMVSLPTYDNNRFLELYEQLLANERGSPLTNHAIASEFAPGSTFKLVTAVGALNEGVITADQKLNDPGRITISNKYFPTDPGKAKDFVCWKEDGHGEVDFVHGLAWSCNVYFYKIGGGYPGQVEGGGLGVSGVNTYAPALGYGAPLGIDLPGEENGLIPNEDWKRINLGENWSTGDTYNTVVGQGFVGATPLQVLSSVSTIANGGKVMWPHLVTEVLDGEGNVVQRYEPCVLWDIADDVLTPSSEIAADCPTMPAELRDLVRSSRQDLPLSAEGFPTPDVLVDPQVIDYVQQGMRFVVSLPPLPDGTKSGTAYEYARIGVVNPASDVETISSAGKTGTGEFCDQYVYNRGLCIPGEFPTHAWYAAYAPYENPEIAVVAFIYYGGEGAVTAGPVVKQVLEAYFEIKSIDAERAP